MGAAAGKGLAGEKARIVGAFVACLADYEAAGPALPSDVDEPLPNFKRRLYASVERFGAKHAGESQTSSSLVLSLQSLSEGDLLALQQYVQKKHIKEAAAPVQQPAQQAAFPSLLPTARETDGDIDDNTSVLSYGDDEQDEHDEAADFFESSHSLSVHSLSPSLAGSMLVEDRDSLRGSVASLHSTQSIHSTSPTHSPSHAHAHAQAHTHSQAQSLRAAPSPSGSEDSKAAYRLPIFETKGGWRSAMESSDAVLQGLSSAPYLSATTTPSGGKYPDIGETIDARNEALMGLQVRCGGRGQYL